ncbi:MAG: SCO family protein [Bryobacteraceae bacterium]
MFSISGRGRSLTVAALCEALLVAVAVYAKTYPANGIVLRVDSAAREVVISHRPIAGYMDAMVMPFRVRDARELDGLRPGTEVGFELVVGNGKSEVRKLRVRRVALDVPLSGQRDKVAIGAAMPDFALTDQMGRTVRLSDFRGKVVAVNFIYTRCPLPDVCPRLSANFARVQARFAARMPRDLVLLSITLDPGYDTPTTLLEYARIWKANPDAWRLLTGSQAAIEGVAARFGMHFWPEEGLITHTSQTAIIGRDGKLAAAIEGSNYMAKQLGDLIGRVLEEQ